MGRIRVLWLCLTDHNSNKNVGALRERSGKILETAGECTGDVASKAAIASLGVKIKANNAAIKQKEVEFNAMLKLCATELSKLANELSTLRAIKEARQVIVVTHNANIAVLGDSELILPMCRENDCGKIRERGSIDTGPTKMSVQNVLEGGPAAFLRRKEIYNY